MNVIVETNLKHIGKKGEKERWKLEGQGSPEEGNAAG